MDIEKKLKNMGIELPVSSQPGGRYLPYQRTNNLVYISGQICKLGGEIKYQGKIGKDLTEQQGKLAARMACINAISVLKMAIGDLDKVMKIVNVHGYVNSAKGFTSQPNVINAASELLIDIFGKRGHHSRCALAVNELPANSAVELEMIVEVD